MVYCLKYIYLKVIQKCNVETRLKIFRKYRLLEKVFANMTASSIYSQEIKSAILLWIFVIKHRRFLDVLVAIEKHRKNYWISNWKMLEYYGVTGDTRMLCYQRIL